MTEPEKWQAVLDRSARFRNDFVYAVSSTRVFCRSTCPSKRPKRENVSFFENAAQAKDAGFRACKRCKPDEMLRESLLSEREERELERMNRFKSELREGKSVLQAGLDAGFGSTRAVYERAPSQLGMTPASYAKGGAKTSIRFGIVPCELGFALVAKTGIGVCSVALGDEEKGLEAQLRNEFFAATIERDEAALASELRLVLGSLHGETAFPDLTLDVRATSFQARVWKELQRIKRGEKITYSELAQRIGEPKAVRAVASACARNPVALVHPCHRVIGKDGASRGFRWNIERKKKLLEREQSSNDEVVK